jgi:uncharacterized membrane protein
VGRAAPGRYSQTGLRALLTGSVVRVRHETTPARGSSQQVAARALTTRAFYRSDESLREVTTKPLQLISRRTSQRKSTAIVLRHTFCSHARQSL